MGHKKKISLPPTHCSYKVQQILGRSGHFGPYDWDKLSTLENQEMACHCFPASGFTLLCPTLLSSTKPAVPSCRRGQWLISCSRRNLLHTFSGLPWRVAFKRILVSTYRFPQAVDRPKRREPAWGDGSANSATREVRDMWCGLMLAARTKLPLAVLPMTLFQEGENWTEKKKKKTPNKKKKNLPVNSIILIHCLCTFWKKRWTHFNVNSFVFVKFKRFRYKHLLFVFNCMVFPTTKLKKTNVDFEFFYTLNGLNTLMTWNKLWNENRYWTFNIL